MNRVFIHNNNLCEDFENRVLYAQNVEVDKYISSNLLVEVEKANPDIIFIKDALSEQYIDLLGLRVAMHIRLSNEKLKYLPIVIVSELNHIILQKLSSLAKILITKNIFLIKNTKEAIGNFDETLIKPFEGNEYQSKFLDLITVEPPENSTTHSIANEWAMYQWSHLLDVSSEVISKNTEKISAMLYFKYLVTKYHLETKSKNKIKQTKKVGSVLFIDDKWHEGWKDVIDSFLKQQYSDVKLNVLEYNFKDKSIDDIKASLEEKMSVACPDIVLLDLRLLESDNILESDEKKSINKLSGIHLISEVKKINPGIQIVMFTASGDSLILDELYNKGILGYVKKDAPDDKYESSKNSFKKLDTLIKIGIDKSYLKTIWDIQKDLLNSPFLTNSQETTIFDLRKNITVIFNISNMPNSFVYTMLAIFKCLELLNDYYLIDKYKEAIWKVKPEGIDNLTDNSTKNKILNIIKHKTTLEVSEFEEILAVIVCSRNYAIHSRPKESCRNFLIKEPNAEHIVEWFGMLSNIILNIKTG